MQGPRPLRRALEDLISIRQAASIDFMWSRDW